MAKQIINIGNQSNDGTGDSIRDAFNKVNANFSDLYNVAGLGQGLSFLSLRETTNSNFGAGFTATNILGISTSGYKIVQQALVAGTGMNITIVDGQIKITNTSSRLVNDAAPALGGYLDGQGTYRGFRFSDPEHDQDTVTRKWVYDNFLNREGQTIYDYPAPPAYPGSPVISTGTNGSVLLNNIYSGTPNNPNTATNYLHLVNKEYADRKISLAGAYSVDPATGAVNAEMGTMTGPLALFRDPITEDDVTYQGLIAATKHYVDNASAVSGTNFYVTKNGRDNRSDLPSYKKGRSLAYAFQTINQAAQAAVAQLNVSEVVLGPYQKTITTNGELQPVTITSLGPSAWTSTATRVTVGFEGSGGTDPFSSGALFPGNYLQGATSGAIGLIEKIGTTSTPSSLEHYDVVLYDYGKTITTDLVNTTGATTGTVVLTFVTPNLINIPVYWIGYIFNVDSSIGGGEGIITEIGYYTDPATLNVYDQITVDFYTPVANINNIPGTLWHVYSNYFEVGEELKFGQYQPLDQITILVESGEYHENYPIKVAQNVSIKGDEFRRSIVKPGTFVDGSLNTISVSPWATTYFRRDTQVDGILISDLNTATDYTSTSSYVLFETPSSITPAVDTGVITIAVTATLNGSPTTAPAIDPAWIGKIFKGNGGVGVIKSVLGTSFSVIPAQNDSYQNQFLTTSTYQSGQWRVYDPVNYGYHYLRNPLLPINQIIENQPGNFLDTVTLLQLNKPYIQAEIVSYLTSTFSTFVFNTATCKRDTGIIVDAIVQDLLFSTSSQSTYAGLQYWAQSGYTGLVGNEITTLTNTISYIEGLAQSIIQNNLSGARYQSAVTQLTNRPAATSAEVNTLGNEFGWIKEILNNGTLNGGAVTSNIVPNGLTTSSNANVWNAYNSLVDNIAYIEAEAVAFVQTTAPGFAFTTATCKRDVGYIIDSVAVDLLYGGNRQAVQAGGYYYNFSSSNSNISGESTQTVAALNRIRSIIPSIAKGVPVASYQSVYSQITSGAKPVTTVAATTAQSSIDLMIDIIQNGPGVAGPKTPLGLVQSTAYDTTTTAALIHANRNFIMEDTVEYIRSNYGAGFTFNEAKCYRDVGTIVDAIAEDLNIGNVAHSLTAADYLRGVPFITTSSQCLSAIGEIATLIDRVLQNIPTGAGNSIYSYQNVAKQVITDTYQPDIAVIEATIGFALNTSTGVTISNGGLGYNQGTTVYLQGGGYDVQASATPIINQYGTITGLTFTNPGSGYTSPPTIIVTPYGTQPSVTATISVSLMPTGTIKPNLNIVQGGQDYYTTPTAIVVGDGTGATVTLSTATVGLFQQVTTATLVSGGSGYSKAYISIEGGATNSIYYAKNLITGIVQVASGDPTFNPPLYNDEMDVFLMNDATILRYLSGQGHGGFMKVLDPEGQVLAKSPYTQTASSFSKSYDRQVFSGGFLVDGFAGNLLMTPSQSPLNGNYPNALPDTETGLPVQIPVEGLFRRPQTPTFFHNNGIRYEVDYISEFQQSTNTSTYQCILNLNPASPGGVNSVSVSTAIAGGGVGTGFLPSTTLSVAFSTPTYPGGIAATGVIGTDGNGSPLGPITVGNGGITFPGVGYQGTPTVLLGGGIIGWNITPNGNIDTSNISIVNPGSGYKTGCPVNFSAATVQAQATIIATGTNGTIWGFNFTNTGSGYSTVPSYTFGNQFNSSAQIVNGYLGALPNQIELVTAGNRSMLANDFTQLNDLGYGIFATNGAFIENVSMFTYYCYTSYYCLNGSQVRTITGSSAYGTYGLVSEGSDPSELPIAVTTINDTNQIVNFIQNPATGSYNVAGSNAVYAQFTVPPLAKALLDVNHRGYKQTYTVVSCTPQTGPNYPANYYQINLDATVATWYETQSTSTNLTGVYRLNNIQYVNGFNPSVLTRQSVVLNMNEDPLTDYRLSAWTYNSNDNTYLTSLDGYNYISAQPWQEGGIYRQGAYNITGVSNATPYTPGQSVTLTFRTPTTITSTASQATTATSQNIVYLTTASISGPIHVGMTVNSSDSKIQNNRVAYVDTTTSQIYLSSSIVSLTQGATITFSGTATVGVGIADSSGHINHITITESGTGYGLTTNTPTLDGSGTYVAPTPSTGNLTAGGSSVSGLQGATVIKLIPLSTTAAARITTGLTASTPYYYVFGYEGYLYKVTGYTSAQTLGEPWDQITIQKVDQNLNAISTGPGGNGLAKDLTGSNLSLGVTKGQVGGITQRISTLRATSHDMVDIGTGGYAESKIPNDLYGPPLHPVVKENQVRQLSRGRVFYVTTDQDGTFSVGGLLEVNQAQAQINFNATINQGPQPSLQLQVGPKINAISNSIAMGGQFGAQDTLPTQYSVNQFLASRLGTDNSGNKINAASILGPGYIDRLGLQGMIGPLNMNGGAGNQNINNLSDPAANNPQDAATKSYADNKISLAGTYTIYQSVPAPQQGKLTGPIWANAEPVPTENGLVIPPKSYVDKIQQLANMSDVIITATNIVAQGPANLDLLMFTGVTAAYNTLTNKPIWNTSTYATNVTLNASSSTNTPTSNSGGADVTFARSNNTLTIKLGGGVASGVYGGVSDYYNPITDYHVNSRAQIHQYKLLMTTATTTATAPVGTQQQIQALLGVSTFDSNLFSVSNGWVTIQTSTSVTTGVPLQTLRQAAAGGIIGSTATSAGNSTYLSSGTVANYIQAITQDGSRQLYGNLLPASQNTVNLGSVGAEYNTIYSYSFNGTATQATALLSSLQAQTYVQATTSTAVGTIVQRNNDGNINGKFIVDDGSYIDPAYDNGVTGTSGSTVGNANRRFSNVYASNYTAPTNYVSTLTGIWNLSGTLATPAGGTALIGTGASPITTINATGINAVATTSTTFYGNLNANYITGQTGMWASTTRPGPTILYITGSDQAYQIKASYVSVGLNSPYIKLTGYSTDGTTVLGGAEGSVKVDYSTYADNAGNSVNANNLQINGGSYYAATTSSSATSIAARDSNSALWASTFYGSTFFGLGTNALDPKITLNSNAAQSSGVLYFNNTLGAEYGYKHLMDNSANYTIKAHLTSGAENTIFTLSNTGNLTLGGGNGTLTISTLTAVTINGSGSGLTNIPGAQINSASIPNSSLAHSTISGIALGSNLSTLTFGTHLTGASYNGSNSVTIATDATSGSTYQGGTLVAYDGNGDVWGRYFQGTATSAQYADLAEKYLPDSDYGPGTVLIFGGNKEVTLSTEANDRKVAGVVSTNPAHMMNAGLDGGVYVALTGRVPCKVVGTIRKGDLIVTSNIPGVAMANNDPKMGTVIGKALENYDSQEIGVIEVVVGRV